MFNTQNYLFLKVDPHFLWDTNRDFRFFHYSEQAYSLITRTIETCHVKSSGSVGVSPSKMCLFPDEKALFCSIVS